MRDAAFVDGLPPELARALRETPIGALPMDADLERALYILKNVPSNTASAMTLDVWRQAWVETWQRANRAEVRIDEAMLPLARLRARLSATLSTDAPMPSERRLVDQALSALQGIEWHDDAEQTS